MEELGEFGIVISSVFQGQLFFLVRAERCVWGCIRLCCPGGKLITQPGWQLEVILTLASGLLEWEVSKSVFVLLSCWRRLAAEHGMGANGYADRLRGPSPSLCDRGHVSYPLRTSIPPSVE